MSTIEVQAAYSFDAVENGQCDYLRACDTMKEAKQRAKYVLSDQWMRHNESSRPLRYARVLVNAECVWDLFRKGYNAQEEI